MTTAIKRRRGTTTQHSTFTGLEGELTVDTTKDTVVVHDGITAGGFPLAKESTVTALDSAAVHKTGDETVAGIKTLSSNPILSAGTANGVAYLNGSKVLTSGSALTFDGTNLNITSGTNQTLIKRKGIMFYNTGASDALIETADDISTVTSLALNKTDIKFYSSGTEQMRLTSTGLGIGTSSPLQKLDTRGNIWTAPAADTGNNADQTALYFGSGVTYKAGIQGYRYSGSYSIGLDFYYSDAVSGTYTRGMRLDSSGNLGLGVTPSAWNSIYRAVQAPGGAAFVGRNDGGIETILVANAYRDSTGTWRYVQSSAALRYAEETDGHKWFTAPSGTAGNAISFTQAMTLDASGRLQLGTTSVGGDLTVFENTSAATKVARFVQANSSAGTLGAVEIVSAVTGGSALDVGQWNIGTGSWVQRWYNNASRTPQDSISGSGTPNFLAGIDSSGNLLVGTTSSYTGKMTVQNGSADGIGIKITGSGGSAIVASVANTNQPFAYFQYGASNVGSITTNGTSTSYVTSSDYRLKENIKPMQGALDVVAQLNPVTYTWKADGSDGQGFIAHELQAVVPDCVTGEKDAVDAEGKPVYQGIDTSFLVATLTKAIQELKAELDATKAEIASLKGV